MSEMLKTNTTLTSLYLGGKDDGKKRKRRKESNSNWLTANDIGVEGAKSLSEMLQLNTTLVLLDLWSKEEIIGERKTKVRCDG